MGKRILVVGSINLDLVVSTNRIPQIGETITGRDFQTFFGGKGANQAVGVARLGYPVSMIGRVGNDEFGRRLRRALSLAGVQAQAVRVTSQTPSGVALITVESQGRNSIVVIPGANGKLTPWDIRRELALVRSAGLILSQLEIPLETVDYLAAAAARFGIPFVLDPAPAQKLPSSLLKRVAWLTPNETEAGILCGASPDAVTTESARKVAKSLLKRGPQNIALKLGSRGVYWASGNGESFTRLQGSGGGFYCGRGCFQCRSRRLIDERRGASRSGAICFSGRGPFGHSRGSPTLNADSAGSQPVSKGDGKGWKQLLTFDFTSNGSPCALHRILTLTRSSSPRGRESEA